MNCARDNCTSVGHVHCNVRGKFIPQSVVRMQGDNDCVISVISYCTVGVALRIIGVVVRTLFGNAIIVTQVNAGTNVLLKM